MEIVYLYIKKFRNLKNQNINFGDEYRFEYKESINELITLKNELYIKDFYNINDNGAKVLNVTSIIGKNGTGKSSILNFIKYNFSKGLNLQDEMILVLKNNNEYNIISTIDIKYDTVLFGKKIDLQKKEKPKSKNEHFFDFGYKLRGLSNTDIIYFSNIFDGSPGGSFSGLYDISTNSLIFEDFKSAIEQRKISRNSTNQVGIHLEEDIFRQVRFLTDDISKDKIKFNLPEELNISVNVDYLVFNEKSLSNESLGNEYKKFMKTILDDYLLNSKTEQSLSLFISYVLLNLVKELLSFDSPSKEFEFNFKYNHKFRLSADKIPLSNLPFDICVDLFFKEVNNQINNLNFKASFLEDLVNNTKSFIDFINENNLLFINGNTTNEPKIFIELKHKNTIDGFLKLYLKTYSVNSYLNFGWRNISSGEKALLNIYSRFYSISNNQKFGQKLSKNLIILIDEGDAYLHPSWQKKFLKNILEYLPIIFDTDERGNKRNLQIIFTSNSPIPASDLLNANTIFLENIIEKDDGLITIVKDSLNDQKETFASNIHTLLSDSFFVKDGLIGDFAVLKINEIIHKLINRLELSYDERENMRKLIHQIGEPVVKHKLMQIYDDRYNMDIHERLDNIEKKLGL
jgi:predicted ATP-dependent endonuclease of OLD family